MQQQQQPRPPPEGSSAESSAPREPIPPPLQRHSAALEADLREAQAALDLERAEACALRSVGSGALSVRVQGSAWVLFGFVSEQVGVRQGRSMHTAEQF